MDLYHTIGGLSNYLLIDYTWPAMIPLKLKLSNFTSYGENPLELSFREFKMAAISGPNGAGKSSLLDAITWCLWGSSRAGDSADDLVHLGANDMQVEFSFQLDGHQFTVKRRRLKKGAGSTSLEFWSGNNNLTEGTIKVTQQKIIDCLHLTFETFTNSSFLRQGHADEFTLKGPTDRKRILADILGLDHYDILEEKAKERSKEIQTKLTLLEYQLLEIEAELTQSEDSKLKKKVAEEKISELDSRINLLEKELKPLQEERAKLIASSEQQQKIRQTLSELQKELADIILQGQNRTRDIKALEEELKELPSFDSKISELKKLQQQLEGLNLVREQRLQLEKKLLDCQGKLNIKLSQQENFKEKLKEIEEKISDLSKQGAKCPTCGQEIGQDKKHKVKESLAKEQTTIKNELKKINCTGEERQIKKFTSDLGKLIFDDGHYHEILKKLKQLNDLQQKRELLVRKQASLESEKKIVTDLRNIFTNKKSQIEKLKLEVKDLPNLAIFLEKIKGQISEKEATLNTLRLEEKEAQNVLGQVTALISRKQQLEKFLQQKLKEKAKLTQEKEIYDELSLAFGKRGIQAMIIESAIPEIEDEANSLLDKLTEGRMKVSFETQRETKTKIQTSEGKEKGIVETLDIIISDEMGQRSYEMYSGGEAFRVNLAIRLALSKLLTHRSGARLQFLVIDEGFGTQDSEGRTRLVEVLDAIKDDFEKILIITHLEELKEEFPIRIEVTKNSSGSTFEVVGV